MLDPLATLHRCLSAILCWPYKGLVTADADSGVPGHGQNEPLCSRQCHPQMFETLVPSVLWIYPMLDAGTVGGMRRIVRELHEFCETMILAWVPINIFVIDLVKSANDS